MSDGVIIVYFLSFFTFFIIFYHFFCQFKLLEVLLSK